VSDIEELIAKDQIGVLVATGVVKSAVEATRAHVGMQDLTTQQWIDIALTKLPVTESPERALNQVG
jgi:hypothetical protein